MQPEDILTHALAARLDEWIGSQPEPRPSRSEAIRMLLDEALAGVAAPGGYRATRVSARGTVDEWRGQADGDEDAAHRLAQRLKSKIDENAEGYSPDETVTLIRPDGGIVTVAPVREMIERLTGWKTAPTADPDLAAP